MSLVFMRNRVGLGETTDWLALLILCAHSIYAVEVPLVIFQNYEPYRFLLHGTNVHSDAFFQLWSVSACVPLKKMLLLRR